MGGDWLPDHLIPAPKELYDRLSKLIREDDYYRLVTISRDGPGKFLIRDGNERKHVAITEENADIAEMLKVLGSDAAMIIDRSFKQSFITTWTDSEPMMDYGAKMDDDFCDDAPDETTA